MLSDDDCAGETSKIRISSLTELSGCQGDSLCTVEDEYIDYTCKDKERLFTYLWVFKDMLSDMLSPPRVECVDGAGAGAGAGTGAHAD
jgi:hypothetical protein